MNWWALVVYFVGFFVTIVIDIHVDPPSERYSEGPYREYRKSAAEVGFEVILVAFLWPIIFPFVLLYYFFKLIGTLLGVNS